ncbi:hypothetical protein JYB88_09590 [Shewanella cyperi]|uniref:Lipoprotein n=1 Tax=Shewanella cyperi TaxID=2814292 RepID=A0A975AIS7_9GAMM|nr:hypothetical protein [Shewanella cyperi]QSX28557.1 hypothetical protein JYB88_09590 [Shewanella cyperi]
MKKVLFLALLFASFTSLACSCTSPTIEESVEYADFIYIGQITASRLDGEKRVINNLAANELLKGQPDTDVLISYVEDGMCSMPAVVGLKYIVFGKKGKTPTLGICGATQVLSKSFGDSEERVTKIKQAIAKKRL